MLTVRRALGVWRTTAAAQQLRCRLSSHVNPSLAVSPSALIQPPTATNATSTVSDVPGEVPLQRSRSSKLAPNVLRYQLETLLRKGERDETYSISNSRELGAVMINLKAIRDKPLVRPSHLHHTPYQTTRNSTRREPPITKILPASTTSLLTPILLIFL